MASREGRSSRAARKRKTISDDFVQITRKYSRKKVTASATKSTAPVENAAGTSKSQSEDVNTTLSESYLALMTSTVRATEHNEQMQAITDSRNTSPIDDLGLVISDITSIGEQLGLSYDKEAASIDTAVQLDTSELCNEFLNDLPVAENPTHHSSKKSRMAKSQEAHNRIVEEEKKENTMVQETMAQISVSCIKAEPNDYNSIHKSKKDSHQTNEPALTPAAEPSHGQLTECLPEPVSQSPSPVPDAQPEEKPASTAIKYRRWSVYEEEKMLLDLNKLLSKKENQTAKLRLLRRQLHVRKVKRSQGLPVFYISSYLTESEAQYLPSSSNPSEQSGKTISEAGISAGLSAPVVSSSVNAALLKQQSVLDRFQIPVPIDNTSHFVPFLNRLHGSGNQQPKNIRSQYTSRILKAYIWRDFETKPPKLKLLNEIRTRRQTEGDVYKDSADSIDYRYVSAEHIPVINRMCHQAFWPTIDLSECLHYSDFSCVAMYKKLIIGFAFMVPDVSHDEAYISFIYTHPEWRGAGIASIMMYHLIQTCMGKDVSLHVSMANPALSLYLKFGFRVVEIIHNFYEKYHPADSNQSPHALHMRLERA